MTHLNPFLSLHKRGESSMRPDGGDGGGGTAQGHSVSLSLSLSVRVCVLMYTFARVERERGRRTAYVSRHPQTACRTCAIQHLALDGVMLHSLSHH